MIRRYLALAESMHRELARAAWKVAGLEIVGSLCFAVGYVWSLAPAAVPERLEHGIALERVTFR